MPSYSYRCKVCDHHFTVMQRMSEDPIKDCPKCSSAVERVIGKNVGIRFVGSGFYVNDSNKSTTDSK